MSPTIDDALSIREAIAELEFDIYEPLTDYPEVVYTKGELEALLEHELIGKSFDAPIRTRAKLAKQGVAAALGYPVPETLKAVKPRFPGQDLDVYVQQSDNLQIWNEEVTPTRRYAVLRVDEANRVTGVRVVEGIELGEFDKTGTWTTKYQAKRRKDHVGSALVAGRDTPELIAELAPVTALDARTLEAMSPSSPPRHGEVLAIAALHRRLLTLVGAELPYSSSERRRGESLHRIVCNVLGLGSYEDTGQFPDILCQALEVKLQSAETIDLGLVNPASRAPAMTLSPRLRHCDVRYLVAYAVHEGDVFRITHIVTSTGAGFFDQFRQFGGLRQNRKIQLRLPDGFFDPK